MRIIRKFGKMIDWHVSRYIPVQYWFKFKLLWLYLAADTNPANINDLVVNDKKENEKEDEEIVIEEFDD